MVNTERAPATLRYIIAERLCPTWHCAWMLSHFVFLVMYRSRACYSISYFHILLYKRQFPFSQIKQNTWKEKFVVMHNWKVQEYVMSLVLDLRAHLMTSLFESLILSRSPSPGQQASWLPTPYFGPGSSLVAV